MNYQIEITIFNVDTADYVKVKLDSEVANKKLTAFKTQILDDAIAQVASGENKRQELSEKNAEFVRKYSLKK